MREYNGCNDMDILTGKGARMEKRIMMDYGVSGRQTVTDVKMFVPTNNARYAKMNYILPFWLKANAILLQELLEKASALKDPSFNRT